MDMHFCLLLPSDHSLEAECPPSALLPHSGAAIHTWLSFYQNNHSTSVILSQEKEIENISLMFQFLSVIGTGIFFCSVSQRYSSALQPAWLIAEVLYQYKWFLDSFNQKNIFSAHSFHI